MSTAGWSSVARPRLALALVILAAAARAAHATPFPMNRDDLAEAARADDAVAALDHEGRYRDALAAAERSLVLRERALDPAHVDLAISLGQLGALRRTLGDLAGSEPLLLRALAIREAALGPTHLLTAQTRYQLGRLYQAQGAVDQAERIYVDTLTGQRRVTMARPAEVELALSVLDALAELYLAEGLPQHARALYDHRLLARATKVLGARHPAIAEAVMNLGRVVQRIGTMLAAVEPRRPIVDREHQAASRHGAAPHAYEVAATDYRDAIERLEQGLGPRHPRLAGPLRQLAWLELLRGNPAAAEPLCLRALAIQEAALGRDHPDVADTLDVLLALRVTRLQFAAALPIATRIAELREAQLRAALAAVPESRRRAVVATYQRHVERLISLLSVTRGQSGDARVNADALALALTTILRTKGRLLDAEVDRQRILRGGLDLRLQSRVDQLAAARDELARFAHDAPATPEATAAIAQRRLRIDALELEVSARTADRRAARAAPTIAEVQAALPFGAVLVEIVSYHVTPDLLTLDVPPLQRRRTPPSPATATATATRDPRAADDAEAMTYAAYLVPWQGAPRWVELGAADELDARVDALVATMHLQPSAADTDRRLAAFAYLEDQLTTGLAHLPPASHLIISPDGKLNLLPFEALRDHQGRTLLERYLVSYASSGRDLLWLAARRTARPPLTPAIVLAAPDFGPGGPFGALPGAAAEAHAIEGFLVAPTTLLGAAASKAALAAAVRPSLLHIATHGVYAPDAPTPAPSTPDAPAAAPGTLVAQATPERGMSVQPSPPAAPGTLVAQATPERGMSVQPSPPAASTIQLVTHAAAPDAALAALDRAGLALAGANASADEVVTAREIAGLDWLGTQLVVLSACDTGVGVAPAGEGLYGMRRALLLAGTEAQVVSLWNVHDGAARQLMTAFYGELARGTGRAEALRRAKLALRRDPRFAHPYYWAPFIAAGDWTPLRPGTLRGAP